MNQSKNTLILNRFLTSDLGTIGSIRLPDKTLLFTLELPWCDNRPNISCIPANVYPISVFTRKNGVRVINVESVPDRSNIEMHSGNLIKHSKGCILPGWQVQLDMFEFRVTQSINAMTSLLNVMRQYPIDSLVVEWTLSLHDVDLLSTEVL